MEINILTSIHYKAGWLRYFADGRKIMLLDKSSLYGATVSQDSFAKVVYKYELYCQILLAYVELADSNRTALLCPKQFGYLTEIVEQRTVLHDQNALPHTERADSNATGETLSVYLHGSTVSLGTCSVQR